MKAYKVIVVLACASTFLEGVSPSGIAGARSSSLQRMTSTVYPLREVDLAEVMYMNKVSGLRAVIVIITNIVPTENLVYRGVRSMRRLTAVADPDDSRYSEP